MRLSRFVIRILRESAKVRVVSDALSVALSSVLETYVSGWMKAFDFSYFTTLIQHAHT